MSRTVYLVGPITGVSYEGATSWREYCRKQFNPGIIGLSPMRGKDYLQHEQMISDSYEQHVLSTTKAIMTRDVFDCSEADVILANFLGAERVSIGSIMEVAWAYQNKKPIVACVEDGGQAFTGRIGASGNPHEHAMMNEAISYKVNSLDAGIHIVNAILTAYVEQ
jgi:nucleoside 2-deoxyribosyltransferase